MPQVPLYPPLAEDRLRHAQPQHHDTSRNEVQEDGKDCSDRCTVIDASTELTSSVYTYPEYISIVWTAEPWHSEDPRNRAMRRVRTTRWSVREK
jgi:hypothetical protein